MSTSSKNHRHASAGAIFHACARGLSDPTGGHLRIGILFESRATPVIKLLDGLDYETDQLSPQPETKPRKKLGRRKDGYVPFPFGIEYEGE